MKIPGLNLLAGHQKKSLVLKTWTVSLLLSLTAPLAAHANSVFAKLEDGRVQADFDQLCGTRTDCTKQEMSITIRRQGQLVSSNMPFGMIQVCNDGGSTLNFKVTRTQGRSANLEISQDERSYPTYAQSGSTLCQWVEVSGANAIKINPFVMKYTSGGYNHDNKDRGIWISKVIPDLGNLTPSTDLTAATYILAGFYKYSLEQLQSFESNIKKTDRRHLVRLKSALEAARAVMVDKDEKALLPVTHTAVQENSRMVMVFATVLNELLDDYGDIEALQGPTKALKNLSSEIRKSYGWNDGLAGSASKSLAALSEVIDLELRELYASAASFGLGDPASFNGLMRSNIALNAAARARNGGDAAVKAQVSNLAAQWNGSQWQQALKSLLAAPQDYSKLVQPKLKLLIMAAESISDLTGENLTIDPSFQALKNK